jgi:hypothetical protein
MSFSRPLATLNSPLAAPPFGEGRRSSPLVRSSESAGPAIFVTDPVQRPGRINWSWRPTVAVGRSNRLDNLSILEAQIAHLPSSTKSWLRRITRITSRRTSSSVDGPANPAGPAMSCISKQAASQTWRSVASHLKTNRGREASPIEWSFLLVGWGPQ